MPDSVRNYVAIRKATEYLEKAGDQAMANFANREAVQFYTQALEWETHLQKPENHQAIRDSQLRRARWHSRIGLAQYGLGSLPDCEKHAREALRLLERPIPESKTRLAAGVVLQVIRQGIHRFFPARYISSKGMEREIAIEVARLYEFMSRVYFYSNETLPVIYITLRFLNEAEKAGTSPELATAYSSMAVLAGFAKLPGLAESYSAQGLAVAEKVNQPSNRITVNVVTGVHKVSVGKWEEVTARALEAQSLCEQLGDTRQWGDSTTLLAEGALISGDLKTSLGIETTLLEESRRRRNPLQLCMALFGVSSIYIRQGEYARAIPMLEEELQILDELPNMASSINSNALLALAHYRLGSVDKALSYASKVLDLASTLSPTVYSLDVGFSAVAEVYFELWGKALQNPNGLLDENRFKQLSEKALKLLKGFRNIFPIGQPYLTLYTGKRYWNMGKNQKAIRTWQTGLEAAKKYRLLYEEGRLHVQLAAALKNAPAEQQVHLACAAQIFETMNAAPDLGLVRSLAHENGLDR